MPPEFEGVFDVGPHRGRCRLLVPRLKRVEHRMNLGESFPDSGRMRGARAANPAHLVDQADENVGDHLVGVLETDRHLVET